MNPKYFLGLCLSAILFVTGFIACHKDMPAGESAENPNLSKDSVLNRELDGLEDPPVFPYYTSCRMIVRLVSIPPCIPGPATVPVQFAFRATPNDPNPTIVSVNLSYYNWTIIDVPQSSYLYIKYEVPNGCPLHLSFGTFGYNRGTNWKGPFPSQAGIWQPISFTQQHDHFPPYEGDARYICDYWCTWNSSIEFDRTSSNGQASVTLLMYQATGSGGGWYYPRELWSQGNGAAPGSYNTTVEAYPISPGFNGTNYKIYTNVGNNCGNICANLCSGYNKFCTTKTGNNGESDVVVSQQCHMYMLYNNGTQETCESCADCSEGCCIRILSSNYASLCGVPSRGWAVQCPICPSPGSTPFAGQHIDFDSYHCIDPSEIHEFSVKALYNNTTFSIFGGSCPNPNGTTFTLNAGEIRTFSVNNNCCIEQVFCE